MLGIIVGRKALFTFINTVRTGLAIGVSTWFTFRQWGRGGSYKYGKSVFNQFSAEERKKQIINLFHPSMNIYTA